MLPSAGLVVLLVLVAVPVLELALLIKVGGIIGLWQLMAIIIGTGFLGIHTLTRHSLVTIRRMREDMLAGNSPVVPMVDASLHFLAGVLLLLPGLISDGLGAVLLIPPLRRWLAGRISNGMSNGMRPTSQAESRSPRWQARPHPAEPSPSTSTATPVSPGEVHAGPIVEGEFERIDETAPRTPPSSHLPQS